MKKLLFDENRALRRGIRLGLSLAALSLAAWLTPLALAGLFARLFEVWGVTADNVLRAPGWVRLLYEGWLYFSGLVQGGVLALTALLVGRALNVPPRWGKGLGAGALWGAAAALGMVLAFRLLDVMRLGYALTRPRFSDLTALLILSVAFQSLGAALATGLVGELLRGWRRASALVGCAAFYALLFGRWTPIGLVNGALFGLAAWLFREKKGGFAPAFGFLGAFSTLTVAVLGMPPRQPGALYETYPVSKPWMTGGVAGPWAGLFMTAILAALILALALPGRKRRAAAPRRPATPPPSGRN